MCELCVDLARLNNTPYSLPRIVFLPSKSIREWFQRIFDVLAELSCDRILKLTNQISNLLKFKNYGSN